MIGFRYLSRRLFNSLTLCACSQRQYTPKSYNEAEKNNILEVINKSDQQTLSRYDITKGRSKTLTRWINANGPIKDIGDVGIVEGFTEKHAEKLFDSIVQGKIKEDDSNPLKKIKGQFLNPTLTESIRQAAKSILSVYVTVSSVSWTLINKEDYEVQDWRYLGIDYPENKRFQLSDILKISWHIVNQLPGADIYVMKAEATTLRASGSDPNNPKVLGVNLQRAQMVSMLVAFISARRNKTSMEGFSDEDEQFTQNIYFLRSSLPFRLYGTLIGNERVTSDQTVEILLQEIKDKSSDKTNVSVPESLQTRFRSQNDLEKDMMGQCFLFALTFMDLCIYKNKDKIDKLLSRN